MPRPVPFPVYGLSAKFSGPRHLVQWNSADWFDTVVLAHGVLASDNLLIVDSLRKEPRPRRAGDPIAPRPPAIDSAVFPALYRAADQFPWWTKPGKAARQSLFDTELDLLESDDGEVVLREWDDTTVIVDGRATSAHARLLGELRAVVLDLPEVFVSVTVWGTFPVADLHLSDVRNRLDDYPPPSIRERMQPRQEPPAAPRDKELLPLHLALRDILENARDEQSDPSELLARIEHVADSLLHVNLPKSDRKRPPH